MANHPLTSNFNYFFGRLNPSSTFEKKASEHYSSVKALIEDQSGLAGELSPVCFLQALSPPNGHLHYQRRRYHRPMPAVVAQPGSGNGERSANRDEIFDIRQLLLNDWRYKDKVRYDDQSMCIKLDTEPRIEMITGVFKSGTSMMIQANLSGCSGQRTTSEDGYARYHKGWLSWKNQGEQDTD